MFKAIWAARWYVLLGFFTFLIILVVNTPLHFVWRWVEPSLARLPVKIEQVNGTLWRGHVRLQIPQLRSLGTLDGVWQLHPASLLSGNAALGLAVDGEGVRLKSDVTVSAAGHVALENTQGFLEAASIAPLLRRNQVTVAGHFELNNLALNADLNSRQLSGVQGQLIYSGGDVGFPVDRKPVNATMPMLIGQLAMEGDKAVINFTTTEGQQLIQGYLQPDGWGGAAIRRRFLDVLGQKWPVQSTEDTVIFEVSHKVL
ncbi:type II secretion system protein N [Thalassolituus sp. LLYu03]|uniref:type II secretion system protein N n=1 Tax=Thalassolituus sp. LLYu03 TaxID=3421656 RepID=UPI003D29071B